LGCVAHAIYNMTITESGNLLAVLRPPKTIGISFLLGSTVGPLVEVRRVSLPSFPCSSATQSFYVSRLLRFSGKVYPSVIGWTLASLRFGGWVFLAAHAIKMVSLSQFVDDFGWLFAMLLGLSAAVDLSISAWIAYFLARRRSQSTLQRYVVCSCNWLGLMFVIEARLPGNFWIALFCGPFVSASYRYY
jgi:hypothetical protein